MGVYPSIHALVRGFKIDGMDILEDISICFVDDGGLMAWLRCVPFVRYNTKDIDRMRIERLKQICSNSIDLHRRC